MRAVSYASPVTYVLEGIRARVAVLPERAELVERGRADWGGKLVAFVLPADHCSGGANLILHEAAAMVRMGVGVNIVNFAANRAGFEANYPENRLPVVYLNRLADLLFILARAANAAAAVDEPLWRPGGRPA